MSYSQDNKLEDGSYSSEKSRWTSLKDKKDSFLSNVKTKLSQKDSGREKVSPHHHQVYSYVRTNF